MASDWQYPRSLGIYHNGYTLPRQIVRGVYCGDHEALRLRSLPLLRTNTLLLGQFKVLGHTCESTLGGERGDIRRTH